MFGLNLNTVIGTVAYMPTTTATTTETTQRCDVKKVVVGSVFSRHSFGKVVSVSPGGQLQLRNETGFQWYCSPDIAAQEFSFADQFETEVKVSRTAAIEAVLSRPRTSMTVNFNKAADPKAVADILYGYVGSGMTETAWRKKVRELMEGEERTMVGHHFGTLDEHKRLQFVEDEKGQRLIDPRTINYVIVERTKYVVK